MNHYLNNIHMDLFSKFVHEKYTDQHKTNPTIISNNKSKTDHASKIHIKTNDITSINI